MKENIALGIGAISLVVQLIALRQARKNRGRHRRE